MAKVPFPFPAPTIEIFPGVHAELIADFDKYSDGSILMTAATMTAKDIGEIGADLGGRWYFTIGEATYIVNMQEVFGSLLDTLTKPVAQ